MPRPQKKRYVCREPDIRDFGPENPRGQISLSVDEYESIRLIDLENYTQEECAEQMCVSRTTVQGVYDAARKKIADALVNGKCLQIGGGDYVICEYYRSECGRGCRGFCHRVQNANHRKTEVRMKIAVTYEDGKIFQHFGHTEHFKVYEIEENTVVKESMLDANGSGHGALAGLLANNGVDTLICGGIGGGAQMALSEAGIRLYGGVQGNAYARLRSGSALQPPRSRPRRRTRLRRARLSFEIKKDGSKEPSFFYSPRIFVVGI